MNHVKLLNQMGSSITLNNNVAHIEGVNKLKGMTLVGCDLRSVAALVIAALISERVSHIYGLEHLDRGYENFEFKLSQLGAQITRTSDMSLPNDSKYEADKSKNNEFVISKAA